MMQSTCKILGHSLVRKGLASGTVLAGMAGMPTAAFAHHHGFPIDVELPVPVIVTPGPCDALPCNTSKVWVEPTYQTVTDRQWIEPTYQTVTERVWVAATTTDQIQHVYVPAQYAWRDFMHYDAWGNRRIFREQVQVSPAHYEDRRVDCVEVPGRYQDVQRQQLVCDGHWQEVQHQVVLTPGHWETRDIAPAIVVEPRPLARLDVRLPF